MIQNYNYEVQTSYTWYLFFIFLTFCLYVTNLIKKLDHVNWFLLFLIRIKFGHAQISVPKIGTPMSKTGCINPYQNHLTMRFLKQIWLQKFSPKSFKVFSNLFWNQQKSIYQVIQKALYMISTNFHAIWSVAANMTRIYLQLGLSFLFTTHLKSSL